MYTKPQYKCGVCNEIYDSIAERMRCEAACLKRIEIEEKKQAEVKKQAEKAASEAKVTEAFDAAYKLRDEHVAKYGHYSYTRKEPVSNKSTHPDWPTLSDVFNFLV